MEDNIKIENKSAQKSVTWKVLGIFTVVAILLCGFVFISNYDVAYDNSTGGGFIPYSATVNLLYFLLAIVFIFAAIILKSILKKRIRIWSLLIASILIPIICYNFNFHALKKDGFLYPLVDEGGILHFIAIGDYNLDGMNDELYHLRYDEREYSTRYGGHFDDTIIDYIDTTAVGTGSGLSGCFCFYDWEERVIELHLDKDSVKLKRVEILVAFQEPSMARNVSFYLYDSKLNHAVNNDNTVSIVFYADACTYLQKIMNEEKIYYIPIEYVVEK